MLLGKKCSNGEETLELVKKLLEEYCDEFPNDLPKELSPRATYNIKLIWYRALVKLPILPRVVRNMSSLGIR